MAIKRFKTDQVVGLKEGYAASPDSALFGVGQLIFAHKCGSNILFGECVSGSALYPAGVVCANQGPGANIFCACPCLQAGGFAVGTGTYVALGAIHTCGATLWRRIK